MSNPLPRIFALSDTHLGAWPSIPSNIDLILHAGDFYDGPQMTALSDDPDDANAMLFPDAVRASRQSDPPIFAVRGNHDYFDPLGFFFTRDVTGSVAVWENRLIIVGVGLAYPRHFELPTESDLRVVCAQAASSAERLVRRLGNLPMILLTHYPGRSMFESEQSEPGWTFDCVDELRNHLKPELVVVGHLHTKFGEYSKYCIIPGPEGAIISD